MTSTDFLHYCLGIGILALAYCMALMVWRDR